MLALQSTSACARLDHAALCLHDACAHTWCRRPPGRPCGPDAADQVPRVPCLTMQPCSTIESQGQRERAFAKGLRHPRPTYVHAQHARCGVVHPPQGPQQGCSPLPAVAHVMMDGTAAPPAVMRWRSSGVQVAVARYGEQHPYSGPAHMLSRNAPVLIISRFAFLGHCASVYALSMRLSLHHTSL